MSFLSSQCNYQHGGQSQKMSIGIVVDSVARPRYGTKKEGDVSGLRAEKEVSNVADVMGNVGDNRGVKASSNVAVCDNDVQEGSVRVGNGSVGVKMSGKDNDHVENQGSRSALGSLQGRKVMHTLQSFANGAWSEPGVGKKTTGERASGKENKRPFKNHDSENFPSVPKQRVSLPRKSGLQEQPDEMENSNKEALRMKLRALLGTAPINNDVDDSRTSEVLFGNVSSGNKKTGDSRAPKVNANEVDGTGSKKAGDSKTPEVNASEAIKEKTVKVDSHFKPWPNSDTIETDSEAGDETIKRPVTRSLTKRKAPARKPRSLKPKTLESVKKEYQGSDIFSFADKSPLQQPRSVNRGYLKVEKTERAKRSCVIKSGGLSCPVKGLKGIQSKTQNNLKAPAFEKMPFGSGAKSAKYDSVDMNKPEAAAQTRNPHHSPIAKEKSQQLDAKNPAPQEKSDSRKPSSGHSPLPHDDLNNIWSKWTKDVPNSPVESCQLTKDKGKCVHESGQSESEMHPKAKWTKDVPNSPVDCCQLTRDKGENVHEYAQSESEMHPKTKCSSKSSTASEKDNCEYFEDADKPEDTCSSTSDSSAEEKDAGNEQFTPLRGKFDSPQEVSSSKKEVEDFHTSPENRVAKKPRLFQSKQDCSHDVDFSDFSPTLPTPKASADADDALTDCFDECTEDGLTRVVSLLGMALEKVKNKMMQVTNRRCSEILVSAAEEIQSQLQNVESQIQKDLGKLTNLKTSKRKHVEARLQEQQEHLKNIHEKFKEEVCKYLQECKGAMEGLEAQHIELQGAIEKQKALHRKLLSQTEATVETHLTDAQKQMMSVRKLGKQKMQQLKVVISQCLKDGISC